MWVCVCTWRSGGGDFDALAALSVVGGSLPHARVVIGLPPPPSDEGEPPLPPASEATDAIDDIGDLSARSCNSANFWLA